MKVSGIHRELDKLSEHRAWLEDEQQEWRDRLDELMQVEPHRWEVTEVNRQAARERIAAYDRELARVDEKIAAFEGRLPTPHEVETAENEVAGLQEQIRRVDSRFREIWSVFMTTLTEVEARGRAVAAAQEKARRLLAQAQELVDQYGVQADLPAVVPDADEKHEALLIAV